MAKQKKITHASIIPLIGGMTIACMEEYKTNPSYILSYKKEFYDNDKLIVNYLNDVKKGKIPYYDLNDTENELHLEKVDVVSTLCPCSGLSQMNTSKNKNKSGSDAEQNEWMYKSSQYILENVKPRVLFGENAPSLSTDRGRGVSDRLAKIAKENGYSFSMIKTNSIKHGIPQKRERIFYFLWDSEKAPLINWIDKEPQMKAHEFVLNAKSNHDNLDEKYEKEEDYSVVLWLRENREYIPRLIEQDCNLFTFILYNKDAMQSYIDFVNKTYDEPEKELRNLNRILKKRADGGGEGYWSDHPSLLVRENSRALTGKTLNYLNPETLEFYTMRQIMELMKLPSDFSLGDNPRRDFRKITQNVPVSTAKDFAGEIRKYLNGELEISNSSYILQNNLKQTITNLESIKHTALF